MKHLILFLLMAVMALGQNTAPTRVPDGQVATSNRRDQYMDPAQIRAYVAANGPGAGSSTYEELTDDPRDDPELAAYLDEKLGLVPIDLNSGTELSVGPSDLNYNVFSSGTSKTYTFAAAPTLGQEFKPYYLWLLNSTASTYTINLTAPGGVTLKSVERNAVVSSFSIPAGGERLLTFIPTSTTNILVTGVPSALYWIEEIQLTHPHQVDGTGATLNTSATSATYGHATFSHSADQAANFVIYRFGVPHDFDANVDLQAEFVFRLGGTDTATHRYVISMASVADSASADSPTFINAVNLDFAGDASGASGDRAKIAWTTLSSWRSSITAGHTLVVKVARDGDASQDASTTVSSDQNLKIKIGHTQ